MSFDFFGRLDVLTETRLQSRFEELDIKIFFLALPGFTRLYQA